MTKPKGKPEDSLTGKESTVRSPQSTGLTEEKKAKLAGLAQGVGQGGKEGEPEEKGKPKGGEVKEEPKKRKGRKKKVETPPEMMEAIKPLISYPIDTLLRLVYGDDTLPLSKEEKSQLAQATDALFNKWFPVLIEKWSEEFAFGLVLLSIFSKRLIIREHTKRVRVKVEEEREEKVEGTK